MESSLMSDFSNNHTNMVEIKYKNFYFMVGRFKSLNNKHLIPKKKIGCFT